MKNVQIQNLIFFAVAAVIILYLIRCSQKKSTKSKKVEHYEPNKIKFYGKSSCPFTVQMVKMLENDARFDYIEVDQSIGKDIPAVPYFYNPKTGKEVVGAHKNADEIVMKLS